MKGRRPEPTRMKVLRGNPGKRALPKNEPKPKAGIPEPPPHLSERGRQAWDHAVRILSDMKVLTVADGFALEQLVENYAEVVELRADVAAGGRTQKVPMSRAAAPASSATSTNDPAPVMIRANPAVAQLADAERRFAGMLDRFGLNPSARAKVSTVGEPAEKNPFAEFA